MHTVTSKLILTPLAEAVFHLILIISEADINKTAIPDLSQLAKVVDSQIVNLVAIGTKIQKQQNADEKLKAEMPKACGEVSGASMRLVTGTSVLKGDPMSKIGKSELLESAKGILAGTSNVLYAFDNFEIRKIINCARLCSLKSYIVKMESATFQPQQMVQSLMQISQTVVQLAQLTTKRISELLSPVLQQRLKIAVDEITRESPLLITSSKALLQTSGNPFLRESRNQSCDRLMDICMEIEIVVQMIVDDDRNSAFGATNSIDMDFKTLVVQLRAIGLRIMASIRDGDESGTKAALAEYMTGCSELRKRTQDFIEKANDSKVKRALQDILRKQQEEEIRAAKFTHDLLVDPKNIGTQNELTHSLAASTKNWYQIADLKNKYDNLFENLLNDSDEHGRKMVTAFNARDLPAVKSARDCYVASTKQLKQRSLEYMEKNKDPQVRKAIQGFLTSLDENEVKTQSVLNDLLVNPNDKENIAKLAQLQDANSQSWSSIDTANNQGNAAIYGHLRNLDGDLGQNVISALTNGDVSGAKVALSKFVPCSTSLTERAIKLNSEINCPADQARVQDILNDQNKVGAAINQLAADLLSNPADPEKLEEFKDNLAEYDVNWGKIAGIALNGRDRIFDKLQAQSKNNANNMIKALRGNDKALTTGRAYEGFKNDNRNLRARAVEYQQKVTDPRIQQELAKLLDKYDASQSQIVNAAESLLSDPSSKSKIDQLEKVFEASDKISSQIAQNDQSSHKVLASLKKDVEDTGAAFLAAIRKQNLPEAIAQLDSHTQSARNFKHNAQSQIGNLSDATQMAKIEDSLQKLENLEGAFFSFINEQKVSKVPMTDEDKIAYISDLLAAVNKARAKVDSDVTKSVVSEVAMIINELANQSRPETLFGKLLTLSQKGDQKNLPSGISGFTAGSKKLAGVIETLDTIAIDRGEIVLANKLTLATQRLKKLEQSVVTALQAVAQNSKDTGANEFANGMIKIWEDNIKDISNQVLGQEGVFDVQEIIAGLKNAVGHHVRLLEQAIKDKDIEDANKHAKNAQEAASTFVAMVEREVENTSDDHYKAELQRKIYEVKSGFPTLISKLDAFNKSWNVGQTWPDFESFDLLSAISGLTLGLSDLGKIMQTQHGVVDHVIQEVAAYNSLTVPAAIVAPVVESWKEEVTAPKLEPVEIAAQEPVEIVAHEPVENVAQEPAKIASQEPVKTVAIEPVAIEDILYIEEVEEEEAPVLLTEEEAVASPLKAVAQELKVEAAKWSNDNPIISAISDIGRCFETLSSFHNLLKSQRPPEAKRGFINSAKDIVTHTTNLVVPSKVIADGCTDLRLKRQLLATLDRLTTLSQQLKIVAAVKAASPNDTDRDQQLIACAQNLMAAIKGCMKDCDTISVKARAKAIQIKIVAGGQNVVKPVVDPGMIFRRRVYRNANAGTSYRTPSAGRH